MVYMGKESEKEWIYVYVHVHFAAQQKLTQHCKSTILQLKLIEKKNNKTQTL